jgi:hypothetical protein
VHPVRTSNFRVEAMVKLRTHLLKLRQLLRQCFLLLLTLQIFNLSLNPSDNLYQSNRVLAESEIESFIELVCEDILAIGDVIPDNDSTDSENSIHTELSYNTEVNHPLNLLNSLFPSGEIRHNSHYKFSYHLVETRPSEEPPEFS